VTEPPLIAVVPPVLVVRDAAVTAALKVVVPVVLTVKAPRAVELPTAPTTPVKVTLPDPAETVKAFALLALLLTVDVYPTALLLVDAVTAVVKTT